MTKRFTKFTNDTALAEGNQDALQVTKSAYKENAATMCGGPSGNGHAMPCFEK